MNANYKLVLAMFLISFAGVSVAAEGERPVAVNTEGLPAFVAAKVKAKAAEGPSELRRYVWITRSQHNLSMRTLAREESAEETAQRGEKGTMIAASSAAGR